LDFKKSQLGIKNKKVIFFLWGYNRASYAKSDFNLKGQIMTYLSDGKARRFAEEFSSVYFILKS